MTKNTIQLWELYQNTWFAWPAHPPQWSHFAIVTAFNPRGKIQSAAQNQSAHEQLLTAIAEHQSVCLMAGDKTMQHKELSVALPITESEAIKLADRFGQNAIYFVAENQLDLVPVLLQGVSRTRIGRFSDFLLPASVGTYQLN